MKRIRYMHADSPERNSMYSGAGVYQPPPPEGSHEYRDPRRVERQNKVLYLSTETKPHCALELNEVCLRTQEEQPDVVRA